MTVALEHDVLDPHDVPAAATRQCPAPSHLPVVPQVVFDVAQLSASLAPSATFAQAPFDVAHVWHVPQLAVVQHVPSTQLPDVHSSSWLQLEPLDLRPGPHEPLRHTLPEAQSASAVQRCKHAPDLHTYALHDDAVP